MISSLETLLLFPLLMLMIFICFKWNSSISKSKKNFPPSPLRLPVIGNLHQLGIDTHRSFERLAYKHGSIMSIHLGSVPTILVSSAEAAREIMKTHDLIFSNRPTTSIQRMLAYNGIGVALAPYGEYWRQSKNIYMLNLLSARRVRMFRHVREDEINLMINMIRNNCGNVVNLSKILVSLTNDVIGRVTFGRKYGDEKFVDIIREAMDLMGVYNVGSFVPALSWVDQLSGLEARARKTAKEIDEFFESVIKDHVDRKTKMVVGDQGDESVGGQDIVDILLKMQQEQETTKVIVKKDVIKSFIMEMFFAGTDSTSASLEWAISELIRNPKVMKKLQKEIRDMALGRTKITEEDLENMQHPYLIAVMKETLRLHPPLPLLLPRQSTQDIKVMGYDIVAGTQVIINASMIARDPTIWEEPHEFIPERFLNSNIDYKGLDFEFIPFGAGRRGCPGIQFAMSVNKLALANLVYNFSFKLPNGGRVEELDMSESNGSTIHRKCPLLVVANPCF